MEGEQTSHLTAAEELEMEDLMEEDSEDKALDQMELSREEQELYGSSEPEEKQNQHSFIHKTIDSQDTTRMTFLHEWELGRPLFTVRFYGQMELMAHDHLKSIIKDLGLTPNDNRIARYFFESKLNVTDTGLSNKGFIQNMNVTRKMDAVRRRVKDVTDEKGGNLK